MYYIFEQIQSINQKLDLLINQPESILGDVVSALIGAIALIISVFIGTQSIKKKIAENRLNDKISEIEKKNSEFNEKVQTVLLNTKESNSTPQHFKEIQDYYYKEIKPLCSEFANASMEVTTGLFIVEEYTKYLLKFRELRRYFQTNLKKTAFMDNKYFPNIYHFMKLIAFFSRESVSLPEKTIIKNQKYDYIQGKLGGPKENYQHNNVVTNINGIRYDPRYFLYYEFFKILVNGYNMDSYRAYANLLDSKIIFPVSKYLFENKIYAPLTIRCKCKYEDYPPFYLMGFKYEYPLGNPKNRKLSLYYVNLINYMYFEKAVYTQLNNKVDLEFYNQKLDSQFIQFNMQCTVYPGIHVIEYKLNNYDSELFYKKNKNKIERMLKKIHKS